MILDAVLPPRTSSLRDDSHLSEPSRAKLCLKNASGRISMLMIADVNVDGETNKDSGNQKDDDRISYYDCDHATPGLPGIRLGK